MAPVTDAEIEGLREEIQEQREEIREDLAEDLGGDPEDYDAETYFRDQSGQSDSGEAVPDGGDSE